MMMIRTTAKLLAASCALSRNGKLGSTLPRPILISSSPPFRLSHDSTDNFKANPVALQMINYAVSHARSQKSDESYGQGLLVLEQCLATQLIEGEEPGIANSRGMVLLAMSTLLSERGDFDEAIEKLRRVQEFSSSLLHARVAAYEAMVGILLELGQDDTSSMLADECLELVRKQTPDSSSLHFEAIEARASSVKGLIKLVNGDTESAEEIFEGNQDGKLHNGNVALSYGEFLHSARRFTLAKEIYQKVIQRGSESKDFVDPFGLAACNMTLENIMLAATCALGQLEAHLGNFADAEELLTKALSQTEESFGSHHPKVGVILTCIALMFRRKAMLERSSSLLIQEGLYRRAIELLKGLPVQPSGVDIDVKRRDIVALAKGGYAEVLGVQQNRKAQGQEMKKYANIMWSNRRLSLAEALDASDSSSKVPVIDARICRVL